MQDSLLQCALLLIFILVGTSHAQVFLVQPRPVLAPIGTPIQLNCSVSQGYKVEWAITLPGMSRVTTDLPNVTVVLEQRGITVGKRSTRTSTLTFSKEATNNRTTNSANNEIVVVVACVAVAAALNRLDGTAVQVTFFGPPSPPTNLTATETGLVGSLNISWSSTSIKGVAVNFTLTATNLNSSKGYRTQDHHYIFNVEDSTSCDVYSFQIVATNEAGPSKPSEIITMNIPSLPDISPIEDSLSHSLVRTNVGVMLTIMFEGTTSCPGSEVINYTLILDQDNSHNGNENIILLENVTMQGVNDISIMVMRDSSYYYQVEVTNEIGSVRTTTRKIFTTEVQAVTFNRARATTFSIQCVYLSGSTASGCVYTLVSEVERVVNVTGIIERNNSEDTTTVMIEVANIGCYKEVLASANSPTGPPPVRADISFPGEACPFTNDNPPTGPTLSPLPGGVSPFPATKIIAVVVAIAIALLLFIILVITLFTLYKKGCCRKKPKLGAPSHSGTDFINRRANEGKGDDGHLYSSAKRSAVASTVIQEPLYSELNQDPIYQVLENPDLFSDKRISNDSQCALLPICPTDGNSPKQAVYQVLENPDSFSDKRTSNDSQCALLPEQAVSLPPWGPFSQNPGSFPSHRPLTLRYPALNPQVAQEPEYAEITPVGMRSHYGLDEEIAV